MTICNMSIEGGARAGLVAPDEMTFEYVDGRPHAPAGADWDAAVDRWRRLPTDDGAEHDRSIAFDAGELVPMVTYGTNPGMGFPITERIPDPERLTDATQRDSLRAALAYMALGPGEPILGKRDRRRLHRLMHELAHQRPARGGPHAARAPGRRRRARHGRPRLDRGEAPGRGGGAGSGLPRGRRRVARGRAARCASP